MTLKFYRRPWKTIGHLFYTHVSFTHHFIDIDRFRFELQSGNAQIGSNLTIFRLPWPWNFTDDLENNRAPLLCPLKLYASFGSHRLIPIWVTVLKRTNWVLTSVTLIFDLWRTDRRTDGQTDRTIHRAAWLQLKIAVIILCIGSTFGNIYSKYAIVYCGYHFSFDYVCSSAIM